MPTPKPARLLDPKNDYVFKRLLADSPELLSSLINAVRHDCPPVVVERVLNPAILPEQIGGKAIVLDVLARTQGGQLDGGDEYDQLRPAVGKKKLRRVRRPA